MNFSQFINIQDIQWVKQTIKSLIAGQAEVLNQRERRGIKMSLLITHCSASINATHTHCIENTMMVKSSQKRNRMQTDTFPTPQTHWRNASLRSLWICAALLISGFGNKNGCIWALCLHASEYIQRWARTVKDCDWWWGDLWRLVGCCGLMFTWLTDSLASS